MPSQRVNINTDLIQWAIQRAGYELEEYLDSKPKVKGWMEASSLPTVRQLEEFTKRLHVPFGYMFLPSPPEEEVSIPFFRAGKESRDQISLELFDTVRIIEKRQDWLSDYLKDEGFDPLDFVGKYTVENSVEEIVTNIRETLDIPIDWAKHHTNMFSTLNYLTSKIEEKRIIVTFNGVVGNSNGRTLKVEECRGFVLIDEYTPFMFINAKDAKVAQVFTLFHELAHIWLGVSAGSDDKQFFPEDNEVELLCDKVAAEFLVPKMLLLNNWEEEQDFRKLYKKFKVSPIVIARRSLELGLISRREYFDFYNTYKAETKNTQQGAGGNFYLNNKKRISTQFARFVSSAVKEKKILYTEAYKLTGLKGKTYTEFTENHL